MSNTRAHNQYSFNIINFFRKPSSSSGGGGGELASMTVASLAKVTKFRIALMLISRKENVSNRNWERCKTFKTLLQDLLSLSLNF